MRQIPNDSVPVDLLRPVVLSPGRPVEMPRMESGHVLICEYTRIPNMPDYTRWYICDSLEDVQTVYNGYMTGQAFSLGWWSALERTGRDIGCSYREISSGEILRVTDFDGAYYYAVGNLSGETRIQVERLESNLYEPVSP